MWISPPRWNAPCKCWTTPSWSSAPPTASKGTRPPCGSCCEQYHIPTFLFVNKTDLNGLGREAVLDELKSLLGDGCVDFSPDQAGDAFQEQVAMCDETLLNQFLDSGHIQENALAAAIAKEAVFPCYFGSALKLEGVSEFLDGLERYTQVPDYPQSFRAKVFKISHDEQGTRLTWLKLTGGTLAVKTTLSGHSDTEDAWSEKIDQIRIYSGAKFTAAQQVTAGTVCAVTGLTHTLPGDGLGDEPDAEKPLLEPVLTYQMLLPEGTDVYGAFLQLKTLMEEDPQLHIIWNQTLQEIHIQLMGEIQLEIMQRVIADRFGLEVSFSSGNILYKETIAAPVEGVGHFEPLRHYAEVHLLLEPLPRGSGLVFGSLCSQDVLDLNWQRLILTHLMEKEHIGVLTGSPITDMRITHPHRPRPHQAHRGRRLPPGHLSGRPAGPAPSPEHPAGTLVRLPTGTAGRVCGTGHCGHPADVRHLRGAGDRWATEPF